MLCVKVFTDLQVFFQTNIMSFEVHLAALLSRSEEYSTTKKFKKETLMNHFAGSRSKPGGLKIEISDIYNFKKKDEDTLGLSNKYGSTYLHQKESSKQLFSKTFFFSSTK